MTAHELALILLDGPDLPVATEALGNVFASAEGALKVGVLEHYAAQHVVIGGIGRRQINPPNWYVSKMIHGEAPEQWATFK